MRHDPITLYRFALRCEDRGLIEALGRAFRLDRNLLRRADLELRSLPRRRMPAIPTAAGRPRAVVHALVSAWSAV